MIETSEAQLMEKILQRLEHMSFQQRRMEVVTLTTALVSKRKSLSINELLETMRDVQYARFAQPNDPDYVEWEKTKDARMARVHK